MHWSSGILIVGLVVGSLCGCAPSSSPSPAPPQPSLPTQIPCTGSTLTLGEITENPNEVIVDTLPLANYLAGRLAEYDIACGNVESTTTVSEMIELIQSGAVDIYMDSMYPATLVSNATGAIPILRRWRNCDPDYFSVIFTREGSGLTSIEALPGHMIAMDRSYSTSGFAMPAGYLLDRGVKLAIKEAWDAPVAADEVGIFLSLDDPNTRSLVYNGKVAAGATDDFNFNQWNEEKPGTFVMLAVTGSVPRQIVLVRPGLGDLQSAIQKALMEADQDPEGFAVIDQNAKTCKFDEPPEGIEAVFAQMRDLHARLKQIPGWQSAFDQGH